jgi:hypothetical protein
VRSEFARFDALLDEHHWLERGLFGAVVRQVAEIDGSWVALVGWGSPAFQVRVRDGFIGWSVEQRRRRLRYVVNNQRFCVLPETRVRSRIGRFQPALPHFNNSGDVVFGGVPALRIRSRWRNVATGNVSVMTKSPTASAAGWMTPDVTHEVVVWIPGPPRVIHEPAV